MPDVRDEAGFEDGIAHSLPLTALAKHLGKGPFDALTLVRRAGQYAVQTGANWGIRNHRRRRYVEGWYNMRHQPFPSQSASLGLSILQRRCSLLHQLRRGSINSDLQWAAMQLTPVETSHVENA